MPDGPKSRSTVLIVDDSTTLVDQLCAAFEAAGFDVGHALDGEEVFRKITAYDPDAVLLDIYMPKINGADVCRLVKAHPHWRKIRLVLMSSRMTDRDIETYRAMGADDFLRKPFEPGVAIDCVRRAIAAGPA